jgi:NAD(P)-dependent dehydrogenase (short-subunit alcohol dehydrogenase family)
MNEIVKDPFDMHGRTVVITGGNGAIGQEMTAVFHARGANVVTADPAKTVITRADDGRILQVQTDVTDPGAVERMVAQTVEHFGSLDVLINNAGGQVRPTRFVDMTPDMFDWEINLNIYGTLLCSQAAAKVMIGQKRGNIINISSSAALKAAAGQHAACYAGCKGFVLSLAKVLAYDLAEYGIRVNTIAPGWIVPENDNNISEESFWKRFGFEMFGGPDKFNKDFEVTGQIHGVPDQPLKRLGRPRDIANAALYFACDASAHSTGQILSISGGDYMPS